MRGCSRVTGRTGAGNGSHPAMVRACSRAFVLWETPGNRRRTSMAARQSSGKGFARSRRWMGTHSQPWRYNSLIHRIIPPGAPGAHPSHTSRQRKGAVDAESGRPVCVVAFSGCGLNDIHHVFGTFADVSYADGESPAGRKIADFSP
jgi:hypothetical protein